MKKLIFISIASFLVIASCSKKEAELKPLNPPYILANLNSMPYYADTLLADSYKDLNLTATGAATTIRPEDLKAKDSASAESYLRYLFIGMTSRTYKLNDNTISVDVMQFADITDAYGYYAQFRPNGIKFDKIGTESFQIGNTRYMVKADYVAVLSEEERTEQADKAMFGLSQKLAEDIMGTVSPPPFSLFFPFSGKINPSLKYYPYEFQGIPGMNEVYTTTYLIGDDSLTLFLTVDKDSSKFNYLNRYAQQSGNEVPNLKRFPYEQNLSVAFKHPQAGIIVGGIKSQKLVGVIGYNPKIADKLMIGWIKGIQ